MQTAMCFKPNGGIGHQQSPATLIPWWVGTQSLYGESLNQIKSLPGDFPNGENQAIAAAVELRSGQGPAVSDKEDGDSAKFSITQGEKYSLVIVVAFSCCYF